MKNALLGIIGTVLGATVVMSTWLYWPLPNPSFDWRAPALESAAQGNCTSHYMILTFVTTADADGVEQYLDEMPFAERCDHDAYGDMSLAEEGEAGLRESIKFTRGVERDILADAAPFNDAIRWWQDNRSIRQQTDLGWLGLPELIWAFRCNRPFDNDERADWLWAYLRISGETLPRAGIESWQRRVSWCRAYGGRQIETLATETVFAETGSKGSANAQRYGARLRLAAVYESQLEAWESQY